MHGGHAAAAAFAAPAAAPRRTAASHPQTATTWHGLQ